jgi:hypothetical protein
MELNKQNCVGKSSDNLIGDVMEGYLEPEYLLKDKAEAAKVRAAIDLVKEYCDALEDEIEIC